MAKNNNSLVNEVFESDWKYAAKVAAITYVIAFWVSPWVIPDVLLLTLQFFARFIVGVCIILSLFKFFFENNKSKPLDFDFDEPTISDLNSTKPAKQKHTTSNESKSDVHTPSFLLDEQPKEQKKRDIKKLWTLEFINSLDWIVYESLCSHYFNAIGVKNNETGLGADGGVDLFLFENNSDNPTAIVQCKRSSNPIKLGMLREFYGVMHQQKVTKGYFFTTNKFYQTSIKFADENNIELVDGALLISLLQGFELEKQQEIYDAITQGDYTTPTCVRCGQKMVIRANKKTQEEFWACSKYKCRSTLRIKAKPKDAKKTRNAFNAV